MVGKTMDPKKSTKQKQKIQNKGEERVHTTHCGVLRASRSIGMSPSTPWGVGPALLAAGGRST
jgi:hypothetical protein